MPHIPTHVGRVAVALLLAGIGLAAQGATNYRARLSPVPMDLAMAANITGSGSLTAALTGSKLTVSGSFAGLMSPATMVQIHKGARGIRGPAVLDLQATPAVSGTISGSVDLTPVLLEDLRHGRLYVQLHSEKAADGNLWGWLMPQESKR